jgi:hypothetical protein
LTQDELFYYGHLFHTMQAGGVRHTLSSEEGIKVIAYSADWRLFITSLLYKVQTALDKSARALGGSCGSRGLEIFLEAHRSRAEALPGYVHLTPRGGPRKAKSGAGF